MQSPRLWNFVLGLSLAALALSPVRAADIDVYLLDKAQGARPNILFILDTSGSMSAFDGYTEDRLDRMKTAFNRILDEATEVNIGLMRFTDPGGPILFPVKYIDGPAFPSDGDTLIVKTTTIINDAEDDAEELLGVAGPGCATATDTDFCDVHLYSPFLDLGNTKAFGREQTSTFTTTHDAVLSRITDFDLATYSNVDNPSHSIAYFDDSVVGLRFSNLPGFSHSGLSTDDATVTFAQLDLNSVSTDNSTLDAKIFGHKASDYGSLPAYPGLTFQFDGIQIGSHVFNVLPGDVIDPVRFICNPNDSAANENDIGCRVTVQPGLDIGAGGGDVDTYYTNGYNAISYDDVDTTFTDATGGNLTNAFADWSIPNTVADDRYLSSNFATALEEIFAVPGWQAAAGEDDIGIYIVAGGSGARTLSNREGGSSDAARMTAAWVENSANTKNGRVLVGLRFQNVLVPSDVLITDATLELYPNGRHYTAPEVSGVGGTVENNLQISVVGEKDFSSSVGAPVFVAEEDHISARRAANATAAVANYTVPPTEKWSNGNPVILGDTSMKTVIGEMTSDADWCGGKAMVLFVEVDNAANAARLIHSFDHEPTFAPRLNIEYDASQLEAGEGCTRESIVVQVNEGRDDSEENKSNGRNRFNQSRIELREYSGNFNSIIGMQFDNIRIPRGSTIVSAHVQFTADRDQGTSDECTEINAYVEKTASPDLFASSIDNLSDRLSAAAGPLALTIAGNDNLDADDKFPSYTAADGDCVPEEDDQPATDLRTIVQEAINDPAWDNNGTLSILMRRVSGRVDISSYNRSSSKAPLLLITAELNKGDIEEIEERSVTVREVMRDIVDDLNHSGFTPIVDTLLEAYYYYSGQPVYYGLTRGQFAGSNSQTVQRSTRVSHPTSYTGGEVYRPNGCDDDNLNSDACRFEEIRTAPQVAEEARYLSPISEFACSEQDNYVVLLTDGQANHPHSQAIVKQLEDPNTRSNFGSCISNFPNSGNGIVSGESCGIELVRHMRGINQDNEAVLDHNPDADGKNNIILHTVGFAISPNGKEFLEELADVGGGRFVEAESADELAEEFRVIIAEAKDKPTTTFAAPAVSVNAFNKLFTDENVFFAYFEPGASASWLGNVKKYKICTNRAIQEDNIDCTLGELIDANDKPILVADPSTRDQLRVREDSLSYWSAGLDDLVNGADGGIISVGGAGGQLRATDPDSRKVLVNLDLDSATTANFFSSETNPGLALTELKSTDGMLDGLTGTDAEKRAKTRELLDMAGATDDEVDTLVRWIRGHNVDDVTIQTDTSLKDTRYSHHDPLHPSPVAVTYGGDADDPVTKVLIATNGGAIRMINAETGKEEWAFYPQNTLLLQKHLRENLQTGKLYGIDGGIQVWTRDVNRDSTINQSEGDFVRMFIGMRRGGSYYYGLDITPSSPQGTADVNKQYEIPPKLMWRIHGGGPDRKFARLGQTWSEVVLGNVALGTATAGVRATRTALFFGGGYEESQDDTWGVSSEVGNAVYVVDARTGERMFFASSVGLSADDHANVGGNDHLVYSGLECPIPSKLATLDTDGDGAIDRLYFGDNCANLFRLELQPRLAADEVGMYGIIGKLASLGGSSERDRRRLQYPPDIIFVRDNVAQNTAGGDYDLLALTTGDRPNILDEEVVNFAYGLRDRHVYALTDANSDGVADNYPVNGLIQGQLLDEVVDVNLFDVTELQLPLGTDFPRDPASIDDETLREQIEALQGSEGWFIELGRKIDGIEGSNRPGEKGLSGPIILGGSAFFTTFVPGGVDPTLFGLEDDAQDDAAEGLCAPSDGDGLIYAVDALTGAAVINWGDVGDSENQGTPPTGPGDRHKLITPDPPSPPVPVFLEPGEVRLLVEEKLVNPEKAFPRSWSYWFQER